VLRRSLDYSLCKSSGHQKPPESSASCCKILNSSERGRHGLCRILTSRDKGQQAGPSRPAHRLRGDEQSRWPPAMRRPRDAARLCPGRRDKPDDRGCDYLMRLWQSTVCSTPLCHGFGNDRIRVVIVAGRLDGLMMGTVADIAEEAHQAIALDHGAQVAVERLVSQCGDEVAATCKGRQCGELRRCPSTGCGFPALAVRRERERSVEDAGSPCRRNVCVTLLAENQYFITLKVCKFIAPTAPIAIHASRWCG
jgi:hypothetical protein